jgi:heptosyltransferase III
VKSEIRNKALPLLGRSVRRPNDGDPDRILIFQPDHLGDILLSQPAVRAIRSRFHDARITAVVGPWAETAARAFWPVDEIVTVAFPGFERVNQRRLHSPYRTLLLESSRLKRYAAGQAFVLRPDAWWASWLAAMIAVDVYGSDDPRVRPFTTVSTRVNGHSHAVTRALQIAEASPTSGTGTCPTPESHPLEADLSNADMEAAYELLRGKGIAGPFAVIHPGSGAPVKHWPENRWRTVAQALSDDGFRIVATGSNSEQDMIGEVIKGVPGALSLAGETPVGVLVAILANATVALGPDCGPLHIAVATGTRSIHLFGPSDERRYGPWGDPSRHKVMSSHMYCSRCGDLGPSRNIGCGCMLAISSEEVTCSVRELIADAPR